MTSNLSASARSSFLSQLQPKRIFALVAGLLSLSSVAAVAAEDSAPDSPDSPDSLVTVQQSSLPVLAGESSISGVLVLGGRAVALTPSHAWILEREDAGWLRADWRGSREILGAAGDGERVFLFGGTGGQLEAVEELLLAGGEFTTKALPPVPVALTAPQGNLAGSTLYVAGTASDGSVRMFSLDTALVPSSRWVSHPELRGATGAVTSVVPQSSGVFVTLAGTTTPGDSVWLLKPGRDWRELEPLPGKVVPGGARRSGQAHALYLAAPSTGERPQLVLYHSITESGAALGEVAAEGARFAFPWKTGLLWDKAGSGAGLEFGQAQLISRPLTLSWADWVVLAVYLAGMTGIGLYFYLREKRNSTSDFFVGSRAIPFWAAGVSLYATNTSSISYIAIPAKAFETNWQYLTNNLVAVLGLVFVAIWIVPLLRRLDLMSVFHYLEIRFHPAIRKLSSALCMLVQIGSRLSIILFLPSLAIATVTGIDVVWCILIMGTITILYTALGGMKAVIWTDFVQLFVMFGGALFAIFYIVGALDGGVGEFLAATLPEGKMKVLDFSWDLTQATVWGFIFLVVFDVVLTFPKDQVLMQRVLSTKSAREAGRSVWTFAAIMIPGGFLFYFIGTALYVYYQKHPERMDPALAIDATFPMFIAAELPIGIVGLIIAGILAASMSTLSSIMNSVATLASVDFYEKMVKNPNPRTSVLFAEAMTVLTGLIGIGAAYLLSRYDIHSLFDVSIELAGLLGGGFAGAYTLGMFTRRANWQGVSIGIASAIVLTTLAWSVDLVHPYFYLAISIMLCIGVGYLASYLFPPPSPEQLTGTTIHGDKGQVGAVAPAE